MVLAMGPFAAPATAKPMHLKSLMTRYGDFLGAGLTTCQTCHRSTAPEGAAESLADFPHNAFGDRLLALRIELRRAGKKSTMDRALAAAATEDSDGDGASNRVELLAGHLPGDKADAPTPAEAKKVRKQEKRFLAYLRSYRWRPFEPVQRPPVPKVKKRAKGGNPIDAFLLAELQQRKLKPRPEARKEILLRRAYLDLTGLSPTPQEIDAFLADESADAYEQVIDRLLASPAYGERWGRHWMDIWRYSDWDGWGKQVRDSKPHIWRWRDWIVESLNADKPYDRMIVEMLAADEIAPLDADSLRATGFLVRNYKRLSREKWMQDTIKHTAQAFLAVTMGCAQCHDHRYDPITQTEYYQFRAFFETHDVRTDWVPGELDLTKNGLPRAYDAYVDRPTYVYERGDERNPLKDRVIEPGVPEALGGSIEVVRVKLPMLARYPEKQAYVIAELRRQAYARLDEARQAVENAAGAPANVAAELQLAAALAAQVALEAVLAVEDLEEDGKKGSEEWKRAAVATTAAQRRSAVAEAELKLLQAERSKDAKKNLPAARMALSKAEQTLKQPPSVAYQPRVTSKTPEYSTGRRTALAKWIASTGNPLTARVAVNQIWMRHFGRAIVPSVTDFGGSGSPPSHPELLDWLAAEFMESGWRMKGLHRLIMTSAAYRRASTPDAKNLKKDPDNIYLWRMNSQRMEFELVRDNVLHTAGNLDRTMGGADIDQTLGLTMKRRSIYFRHAPEKQMVFSQVFDGPSVVECYMRKHTIIPQQALALANSEMTLRESRLLARKLTDATGDAKSYVQAAFKRVLARRATADEIAECLKFLEEQAARLASAKSKADQTNDGSKPSRDPGQRARENLVLVLFNHHDFVTIR